MDLPAGRSEQIAAAASSAPPPPPSPSENNEDSLSSPRKQRKKKKKIVFVNPLNPNNPKRKKAAAMKAAAAKQLEEGEGERENSGYFDDIDGNHENYEDDYTNEKQGKKSHNEKETKSQDQKKRKKKKKFSIVGRIKGGGGGGGGGGKKGKLEVDNDDHGDSGHDHHRDDDIAATTQVTDDSRGGGVYEQEEPSRLASSSAAAFQDYDPLNPPTDTISDSFRDTTSKPPTNSMTVDPDIMSKQQQIVEVVDLGDDTITGEEDDEFDVEAINLKQLPPLLGGAGSRGGDLNNNVNNRDGGGGRGGGETKKINKSLLPFDDSDSEGEDDTDNAGGDSEGSMGSVGGDVTATTKSNIVSGPISLILLLVESTSLRFELLQLEFDTPQTAFVRDVLTKIEASVTEPHLRNLKFVGVMDRLGQGFNERAPLGDALTKRRNNKDILVVVTQGTTTEQTGRLARPILGDEKVIGMLQLHGYDVSGWAKDKKSQSKISDSDRKSKTDDGRLIHYILAMAGVTGFVLIYMIYRRIIVGGAVPPSTLDVMEEPSSLSSTVNNDTINVESSRSGTSSSSSLQFEKFEKMLTGIEMDWVDDEATTLSSGYILGSNSVKDDDEMGVKSKLDHDHAGRVSMGTSTSSTKINETPLELRLKAEEEARIKAEKEAARLKAELDSIRVEEEEARKLAEEEAARLKAELDSIRAEEEQKEAARLLLKQQEDAEAVRLKALAEAEERLKLLEEEREKIEKERLEEEARLKAESIRLKEEEEARSETENSILAAEEKQSTDETGVEGIEPDWRGKLQMYWEVAEPWVTYIHSWISYFVYGKPEEPEPPKKKGWISYLIFGERREPEPKKQGWISWLIFGTPKVEETADSLGETGTEKPIMPPGDDESGEHEREEYNVPQLADDGDDAKEAESEEQVIMPPKSSKDTEDNATEPESAAVSKETLLDQKHGSDTYADKEVGARLYAHKTWEVTNTVFSWISYFIFGSPKETELQEQGWISYLIFGKQEQPAQKKQGWLSWLIFGSAKEKNEIPGETQADEADLAEKALLEKEPVDDEVATVEGGRSLLQKTWNGTKSGLSYIHSWVTYVTVGSSKQEEEIPQKQGWISYMIFGKRKEAVQKKQGWISWMLFGSPQESGKTKRGWWYYFKLIF